MSNYQKSKNRKNLEFIKMRRKEKIGNLKSKLDVGFEYPAFSSINK